MFLVLRSISKKQAASTPGSTPNTTAMTPPASAAGSMEQTSALSRSALLRPLSAVKSVFSGAMFNRTETTKTDVAADGSFRTQSILVAQDCQDIEQLEEEEEEEEGGTAEGPTSYSQPAVQQTGAAEASLAVDAISMCELPPGPGPLHMAAKYVSYCVNCNTFTEVNVKFCAMAGIANHMAYSDSPCKTCICVLIIFPL